MNKIEELCCLYISLLRTISMVNQQNHWIVKGKNFYGNHLLFERIYKSAAEDADSVAERLVGLFGTEVLDFNLQANLIGKHLKEFASGNPNDGQSRIENSLEAERRFLALSESFYFTMKTEGKLSLGLDDLIMSVASNREASVYLLKQAKDTDIKSSARKHERKEKLNKLANKDHEKHEYRGFVLDVYFEDGDWIADISKPGDKEGYMPAMSMHKNLAISHAKEKINKIYAALDKDKFGTIKRRNILNKLAQQNTEALKLQQQINQMVGINLGNRNWGAVGLSSVSVINQGDHMVADYNVTIPANSPPFSDKHKYPQGLNQFKQEMMTLVAGIAQRMGIDNLMQVVKVNGK